MIAAFRFFSILERSVDTDTVAPGLSGLFVTLTYVNLFAMRALETTEKSRRRVPQRVKTVFWASSRKKAETLGHSAFLIVKKRHKSRPFWQIRAFFRNYSMIERFF